MRRTFDGTNGGLRTVAAFSYPWAITTSFSASSSSLIACARRRQRAACSKRRVFSFTMPLLTGKIECGFNMCGSQNKKPRPRPGARNRQLQEHTSATGQVKSEKELTGASIFTE
jgi:hypothetical protein